MKCPMGSGQEEAILLAYSSGELDTETAVRFGEHIETCSACREQASAHLAMWNALDRWEAPPVSTDFDQRLYRRIQQESSWWEYLLAPLRPLLARRALTIAAAAALIIIAVLAPVTSRSWLGRKPAVPESAAVEAIAPEAAVPPDQAEQTLQEMETLRDFSRLMHPDAEPKM